MPSFPQVSPPHSSGLLTRIRLCLGILIAILLVNGITGFSLIRGSEACLNILARTAHLSAGSPLFDWLSQVHHALVVSAGSTPFLAYSTDSLALAYILFALLFLGPYRDPVRNQWVINFGLVGCLAILLLAAIAGPLRGVAVSWRMVNACFALACALPLLLCRHYLSLLKHMDRTARRQRIQRTRRIRLNRKARDRRSFL